MLNYETLNKLLDRVEALISSPYHFKFPDLSHGTCGQSDIMISVLQARVITEGLCRFIVLHEHLVKSEKSLRNATLKVYLEDLLRPNLIVPKPIMTSLTMVQETSNIVVHFQVNGHVNAANAEVCLECLSQIMEWFLKNYSPEAIKAAEWKISSDIINVSGRIPPKAEGCIISRQKEIETLRMTLSDHPILGVYGPSGVGKTELIKDYVRKYNKQYDGVYYTENVDNVTDFLYQFPLKILDEAKKTKEEIIHEKLDAIHSMELAYLFIIDNYTGAESDLTAIAPDEDDNYHLLFLVNEEFCIEGGFSYYEVLPFSPEASNKIFSHFCNRKLEKSAITNLLSYLKYNPRAIKMSATFLSSHPNYSPADIVDGMQENPSITNILKSLYTLLTGISILETNDTIRFVSKCLCLLPYSGFSVDRFEELLINLLQEDEIKVALEWLANAGWIVVDSSDETSTISITPLLSDTIFESTGRDLSSDRIVRFLSPILSPIDTIRELLMSQVVSLGTFVDHLLHRVLNADSRNLDILNQLREYYIALNDIEKIQIVSELMESEFNRRSIGQDITRVENAIFRQGISWFNLENFQSAHDHFSKALISLEEKQSAINKAVARIAAYDSSALAGLGLFDLGEAAAAKSIRIREQLASAGDDAENKNLWISHYNYAKALMFMSRFDQAEDECRVAIRIYSESYPDAYKNRTSTDVSSLLQLMGRIHVGQEKRDAAIDLLEKAKEIRENLKGDRYFSTAQVYSYLMDAYLHFGEFRSALFYAQKYYDVLLTQYKTNDLQKKIIEVEEIMTICQERIKNES